MAKFSPQEIENRKYFTDKLNYLTKLNKKKQVDLHRDLGIPKSTLTGYYKGTSLPNPGNLQKIADYFNVVKSELDLRFRDEEPPKPIPITSTQTDEKIINTVKQLTEPRKIKVLTYAENELEEQNYIKEDTVVYSYVAMYGSISAGTGHYIYDNPIEQVRVQGIPPQHDLALKVSGDSMLPLFEDGEIVYIKKTPEVLNGQIGAFILDGEAYLKKLYNQNGKIRLVSLNKKYPDIEIKEYRELTVVGKVIL